MSFGRLDGAAFNRKFGVDLETYFAPALQVAEGKGWLRRCIEPDTLASYELSEGSFRDLPQIRALFYSSEAVEWLSTLYSASSALKSPQGSTRNGVGQSSDRSSKRRARRRRIEGMTAPMRSFCTSSTHGSTPPDSLRVPFTAPLLGEDEERAVAAVVRGGRLVMGPNVRDFEAQIAEFCGRSHAVAVTSGTSALQLALHALGVGPGWEVYVPGTQTPHTLRSI